MRYLLFLFLLMVISSSAFAETTTCILDGGSTVVKAVAWDDVTNAAKVTYHFGGTRKGIVTLKQDHLHGEKINIYVDYEKSSSSTHAAEYIVFPISPGSHRIIGVAYTKHDGERFLSSSHGNHAANCVAM